MFKKCYIFNWLPMLIFGVVSTIVILVGAPAYAQSNDIKFSHLDIEDGLSNNQVNTIIKDRSGFMWFGTMSGLNRFDGYDFKVFRHVAGDSTSLSDSYIEDMLEDRLGRLWIRTRKGLNRYDPKTEKFTCHPNMISKETSINPMVMSSMLCDENGIFWIAFKGSGLYKIFFDEIRDSTKVSIIEHQPGDTSSLHSNNISDIQIDALGNLWLVYPDGILEKLNPRTNKVEYRNNYLSSLYKNKILSYRLFIDSDDDIWICAVDDAKGVFYFNGKNKKFVHLSTKSNHKLSTDIIKGGLAEDDNGRIWIGTDHGGVNILDKLNFNITYLFHDNTNPFSVRQNVINCINKDNTGTIWIGTFKKGISYYREGIFNFKLFRHNASDTNSLPFDDIQCFEEDRHGNLWIGTNGGGLIYFNRERNTFKRYQHDEYDPNSLSSDVIISLELDSNNNLWIGTFYGGLNKFDGEKFTKFRYRNNVNTGIASDKAWRLYEDFKGTLWIGTLGAGLDTLNRETGEFTHFKTAEGNSIHSDFITDFEESQNGDLWIGTSYGIDHYDRKNKKFTHIVTDSNNPNSLSNFNVNCIHENSQGNLWIGTRDGLNFYDKANSSFRVFRTDDGLPDNAILTILEDAKGNLWLATSNGLSNMLLEGIPGTPDFRYRFINYDSQDGLQGREFNVGAAYKTRDGKLFFGGANGMNVLSEEIGLNTKVPKVAFTNFQVFNKSIQVGQELNGRVLLEKSITYADQIALKHSENIFSIEFAVLDFFRPVKNKYAYMLEGFNNDWLITGGDFRKVTYTNLDPGSYTFKVRASNAEGYWSDEIKSLKIVISPPFWKTPLAFVIYGIFITGALLLARTIILERERMKHKLELERQEGERMHELDMIKTRFFTNVSHELRTPLSLIIAPIEKLVKTIHSGDQQRQLIVMQRNAKRLLNLVNQLLDFRKMEVQKFKLNPGNADIIRFIKETSESFIDLSENNDIQFEIKTSMEELVMSFDQDKMEKIIFNLLSNAFKFTPQYGTITISIDVFKAAANQKQLSIKVMDSGIGIPKDKLDKIFDRFFQNTEEGAMMNPGSGIGLALTKEFVELHDGSIYVNSQPNEGSTFIVTIPVTNNGPIHKSQPTSIISKKDDHPNDIFSNKAPSGQVDSQKQVVLLVEDNDDFRFYLKDNLKSNYTIVDVTNGKEGWEKVLEISPKLIVSDIMMPVMDGLELCAKVKGDLRTRHIPIILLSAQAEDNDMIRGYETLADDYITKPFNFEILQSRIKNLIAVRQSLDVHEKVELKPSEIVVKSAEADMVRKITRIIEANIDNVNFSVEELSRELGMSRVNLYKKLLAITNKTPIQYIRHIRLKRAAQLLSQSQMTVAEVAYQVGFNNPKNFAKYFKAAYKILPSKYAKTFMPDSEC
ncbi:two-component regulator propeller domain-containing protein [Fulvivirgaceae bacterium BMA12]|uniref:histidine kinase n=1 Tax=Agaribacillus aureus TaxID=3051825 RepID=A0ABT8LCK1_9BACT|nr:two-component regulator propeller domain-containing protein [Fulvivirgaceae bacterium BMA12]